jgi:hypothetical protein
MTNPNRPANLLLASALAGLLAQSALAQAPAQAPSGVGTITHLSGTLTLRKSDGSTRLLSVASAVGEGDTLLTAQNTYARLKLADGGEMVMRPESQMKLDAYKFDERKPEGDNVLISLLKGGMRSVTGLIGRRSKDKVAYTAGSATIGIRGTHFGALVCQNDCARIPTPSGAPPANGLHVDVMDGAVTVSNNAGQQVLNAGQFGYVRDASTPPIVVPQGQGIQVTMPLVISRNAGSGGAGVGKQSQSECAVP